MKILILCPYYERPILVQNALNSLLKANEFYQDWVFALIDDGSSAKGRPIVESVLKDHQQKLLFYDTHCPKDNRDGAERCVGYYCNEAIKTANPDLIMFLGDDDELFPSFLKDIVEFFHAHDRQVTSYSHVIPYNPAFEISSAVPVVTEGCSLNRKTSPVRVAGRIDASQMVWTKDVHHRFELWFTDNVWRSLDFDLMMRYYHLRGKKDGRSPFTGLISQYKGIHSSNMLTNAAKDLKGYDQEHIRRRTSIEEIVRLCLKYTGEERKRIARIGMRIHGDTSELLSLFHGEMEF